MENSFTQKVILAQEAIGTLHRDATNPHFKSKYTTLDHILEVARPALGAHGLLLSQHLTASDTVITRISDGTGELTSEVRICGGTTSNPQQFGSAVTYARRYALTALLAISTDTDDDGQVAATNTSTRVTAKPTKPVVAQLVDAAEVAPLTKTIEKARDAAIVKQAASFDPHLAAQIIAAGEIECGFGKHNGKALRDMPPSLVKFWAERELKPYNGALSEVDVEFKAAAALWERGLLEPELLHGHIESTSIEADLDLGDYHDDDIPF